MALLGYTEKLPEKWLKAHPCNRIQTSFSYFHFLKGFQWHQQATITGRMVADATPKVGLRDT